MQSNRSLPVIVGLVAVVLQLVLAPALTLGGVAPAFVGAVTIAYLVVNSDAPQVAVAFGMGLAADLVSGLPLGCSSLALIACAYLVPLLVETIGNDSLLMATGVLVAGSLCISLITGILMSVAGFFGPIDALVRYILPETLYATVLSVLSYLLLARTAGSRTPRAGATMTNIRFN